MGGAIWVVLALLPFAIHALILLDVIEENNNSLTEDRPHQSTQVLAQAVERPLYNSSEGDHR